MADNANIAYKLKACQKAFFCILSSKLVSLGNNRFFAPSKSETVILYTKRDKHNQPVYTIIKTKTTLKKRTINFIRKRRRVNTLARRGNVLDCCRLDLKHRLLENKF